MAGEPGELVHRGALVSLGYAAVLLVLRLAPDMARHLVTPARLLVLTFASWPLATYLLRIVPSVYELGGGAHIVLWVVAAAIAVAASRFRGRPLAPLAIICGLTVLLLLLDLAVGAPLQMSSLLGYSPHTAARFTGFGNTTFAVFGACAVVAAALPVVIVLSTWRSIVAAVVGGGPDDPARAQDTVTE